MIGTSSFSAFFSPQFQDCSNVVTSPGSGLDISPHAERDYTQNAIRFAGRIRMLATNDTFFARFPHLEERSLSLPLDMRPGGQTGCSRFRQSLPRISGTS
jgi:hypothetical protein